LQDSVLWQQLSAIVDTGCFRQSGSVLRVHVLRRLYQLCIKRVNDTYRQWHVSRMTQSATGQRNTSAHNILQIYDDYQQPRMAKIQIVVNVLKNINLMEDVENIKLEIELNTLRNQLCNMQANQNSSKNSSGSDVGEPELRADCDSDVEEPELRADCDTDGEDDNMQFVTKGVENKRGKKRKLNSNKVSFTHRLTNPK
jgi:hypothetical protein